MRVPGVRDGPSPVLPLGRARSPPGPVGCEDRGWCGGRVGLPGAALRRGWPGPQHHTATAVPLPGQPTAAVGRWLRLFGPRSSSPVWGVGFMQSSTHSAQHGASTVLRQRPGGGGATADPSHAGGCVSCRPWGPAQGGVGPLAGSRVLPPMCMVLARGGIESQPMKRMLLLF